MVNLEEIIDIKSCRDWEELFFCHICYLDDGGIQTIIYELGDEEVIYDNKHTIENIKNKANETLFENIARKILSRKDNQDDIEMFFGEGTTIDEIEKSIGKSVKEFLSEKKIQDEKYYWFKDEITIDEVKNLMEKSIKEKVDYIRPILKEIKIEYDPNVLY